MRNRLVTLLLVCVIFITAATVALAGGDQVRGDKAVGPATQVQTQDPPPFQP